MNQRTKGRIVGLVLTAWLAAMAISGPARATDETARLKTFSAIGKGSAALDGYGEAGLLRHPGKGCLTHMWFGGDWKGYDRTRIRVYVDGEKKASIDMELGLGHGIGFGDDWAPWGSERMGKTGHPSGLYNTFRIPFGKGVRVTAQRPRDAAAASPFWWIVRGTEHLPVVIGGIRLPASARLRLHRLEQYTAKPMEEFSVCESPRAGMLYQVTLAARGLNETGGWKNLSFLEACMRAYVDGAREPMLLSSGLEDYFLGTYYFNRGRYATALSGLTHFDAKTRTVSAYRFHDEDPIVFHHGFRLTCRCGETEDGAAQGKPAGDPPSTEYTTYAWVYEW